MCSMFKVDSNVKLGKTFGIMIFWIFHQIQFDLLDINIAWIKDVIFISHVATFNFKFHVSGNHQATDSKKNKFTIIVLESADPFLPDRVEFKHTSLFYLKQAMLFI